MAIAHRHEQFKVEGAKAKAQEAMDVLQALYEIAERPIDPAVVQLTLASDSGMTDDGEAGPMLVTRRADLRARTPTQAAYLENLSLIHI